MVHVFHTKISKEAHQHLIDHFLGKFASDFQQKVLRYRKWEDAQQTLLGRVLLQLGVQRLGQPFHQIAYSKTGKPYFKNAKTKFNISHSGGRVVCAITDLCDLGIDIEEVKTINITDFNVQMTAKERYRVTSSLNQLEAFYSYWTQKEAVIKAHGAGLSIPLPSFEIHENKTAINGERFFLQEVPLSKNHQCFLATKINTLNKVKLHEVSVVSLL